MHAQGEKPLLHKASLDFSTTSGENWEADANIRLTHVRLQRPKPFPAKAGIKEDMESPLSQVLAPSALAPVNGEGVAPFAQQPVVLTKQAYIELPWQANYWRAQYEQLVERETTLKAEVEAYQATIRDLTQRLYGTKSEKATHRDKGVGKEQRKISVRLLRDRAWRGVVSA